MCCNALSGGLIRQKPVHRGHRQGGRGQGHLDRQRAAFRIGLERGPSGGQGSRRE